MIRNGMQALWKRLSGPAARRIGQTTMRRNFNVGTSATFYRQTSIDFDMANCFTHTEEEGFVRQSAYDPIVVPEMSIDQYVWRNLDKWQDKCAVVCFSFILGLL